MEQILSADGLLAKDAYGGIGQVTLTDRGGGCDVLPTTVIVDFGIG